MQGHSPFEAESDKNPDKFWTSLEVITWCKPRLKAVAPPGVRFHYSDTGFQLLGLIVEKVTGKPLAGAVREFVLDPLSMRDTYAEFREEPRRSRGIELSHSLDGKVDRTGFVSESADWGGGGWITTASDLSRFLLGLNGNTLFHNPATWRLMQEWSAQSGGHYGLGLEHYTTSGGDELLGHGGAYSSVVAVWPERSVVIVATMNQSSPAEGLRHRTFITEFLGGVCSAVKQTFK